MRRSWWQRSLNTHFRALEERRRIEERRITHQKERTLKQQEQTTIRVGEARKRAEAITGIDALEAIKVTKELIWRGKWNKKRAKWDARARKWRKL